MHHRAIVKLRPGLERLENKQLLSAGPSTSHSAALHSAPTPSALPAARDAPTNTTGPATRHGPKTAQDDGSLSSPPPAGQAPRPPGTGFLAYRITNPNSFNNRPIIPTYQVLVQARQPIPGQVYNVLYITVRNGTAQTFTASNGFEVKFPGEHVSSVFPILTGDEAWKPGQVIAFYVLSKKYYPVHSQVHSGFEFNLGGARSIAIPGPSGIYQHITYDPAKFPNILNFIVTAGVGAQGGTGFKYGLPDTAINEIVSARTKRMDFGGHF